MLGYLKIAGAGLFVAFLIILGWKANDWRTKANMLEIAKLELRNEIQRRVSADAHRLAVEESLAMAESQTNETVKEVIKRVIVRVPDNRDCDLNDDVVRMLDRARGNDLPDAPRAADDATAATPEAPKPVN